MRPSQSHTRPFIWYKSHIKFSREQWSSVLNSIQSNEVMTHDSVIETKKLTQLCLYSKVLPTPNFSDSSIIIIIKNGRRGCYESDL